MTRKNIMLCYPYEDKRFNHWGGGAIIQPKLDGIRCRAVIDGKGNATLYSSQDNVIISVPHINIALGLMKLKDIELDGELYVHGMPFEDIVSIAKRTKNIHPNSQDLQYHIFDIIKEQLQHQRIRNLISMMPTDRSIKRVTSYGVGSIQAIERRYKQFINEGYEGFILRHLTALYKRSRATTLLKYKPKKRDVYKIIGFMEERDIHGKLKNTLGAIVLSSGEGEGTFHVGIGFTNYQREYLWGMRETLLGKNCIIQYQQLTKANNVPRFPVFVDIQEEE